MKELNQILTITKPTLEEAKGIAAQMEFAIAHMYSELEYGKIHEVNIVWDELIELRAFSESEEIHIYEKDGNLTAVYVTEQPDISGQFIDKKYELRDNSSLYVRSYLISDEDGQAVVKYTRAVKID